MKKKFIFIFLAVILIGAFVLVNGKSANADKQITVYKSPTCGCCVGYIAELKRNGYDVNVEEVSNMEIIKERYNIPRNMQSCHTSVMGDYFIEGHVPIEVVDGLLEENPMVNGISLPNMPAGSPGMPGVKQGDFIIYSLDDEKITEYRRV